MNSLLYKIYCADEACREGSKITFFRFRFISSQSIYFQYRGGVILKSKNDVGLLK